MDRTQQSVRISTDWLIHNILYEIIEMPYAAYSLCIQHAVPVNISSISLTRGNQ